MCEILVQESFGKWSVMREKQSIKTDLTETGCVTVLRIFPVPGPHLMAGLEIRSDGTFWFHCQNYWLVFKNQRV
jgi:hypothetical protein